MPHRLPHLPLCRGPTFLLLFPSSDCGHKLSAHGERDPEPQSLSQSGMVILVTVQGVKSLARMAPGHQVCGHSHCLCHFRGSLLCPSLPCCHDLLSHSVHWRSLGAHQGSLRTSAGPDSCLILHTWGGGRNFALLGSFGWFDNQINMTQINTRK